MCSRISMAYRRRSVLAFVGCLLSLSLFSGCASSRSRLQTCFDRSAAKLSFVSWNARSLVTEPREATQSRALQIASLSRRELYRLMQTHPAPDLASIAGKWHGINKGFGPAVAGLMQDVKVLEGHHCVHGHNVLVKQVAISDLKCRGWRPELDPTTCQPKTMGNFVALPPDCRGELGHVAKFDYTQASNPWYDPSRFLIDDIVQIDDNLLLGRATAKVGWMTMPVAYFVLTRAPTCQAQLHDTIEIAIDTTAPAQDVSPDVLAPAIPSQTVYQPGTVTEPSEPTKVTEEAEGNRRQVIEVEVEVDNTDSQPSASDKTSSPNHKSPSNNHSLGHRIIEPAT